MSVEPFDPHSQRMIDQFADLSCPSGGSDKEFPPDGGSHARGREDGQAGIRMRSLSGPGSA